VNIFSSNVFIVCICNTAVFKLIPILCTHVYSYMFSTVHPECWVARDGGFGGGFFFFFNFFNFFYLSDAHDAVLWSEPEHAHRERRRRRLQPIVTDDLQPLRLHDCCDRHAHDRDDEADADPLQQRQAALVAGDPPADERHNERVVQGDEEQRRDGAGQLEGGGRDLEVGAHVEVHREALLQEHDRHLLHAHHEHQRRHPHRHHARQKLHFLHVRHRAQLPVVVVVVVAVVVVVGVVFQFRGLVNGIV
jgi:hypothetical protein